MGVSDTIGETKNIAERLEELEKTEERNYKQPYISENVNAMTDMINWLKREQIISESMCIGDAIKPEDMLLDKDD